MRPYRAASSGASRWCRALERRALAAKKERPNEFGPATEALFDLVADSDLLPIVAPHGRVGAAFASRCLSAAAERKAALSVERAALLTATRLLSAKEGRPPPSAYRHRNRRSGPGRTGGRDGSETRQRTVRSRRAGQDGGGEPVRPGPRMVARLAALAATYEGEPEEGLAPGQIAIPGTVYIVDRRGRLLERPVVPGSSIVLGPHLFSGRRRLRVERAAMRRSSVDLRPQPLARQGDDRARRRFGLALAIVDAAWPQAGAEIRARTRLVLPLEEPGLVSFSMASRPGVSYINLRAKTLVDLADDLLHETAHHRLHAIETRRQLLSIPRGLSGISSAGPTGPVDRRPTLLTNAGPVRPAGDSEPGRPPTKTGGARPHAGRAAGAQGRVRTFLAEDELRYWSPWRRALRPVRGILHACYTFTFRAELLERIAAAARAGGWRVGPVRVDRRTTRRLLSEARRERTRLAGSLRDLDDASSRGAFTLAGRTLLALMRRAARASTTSEMPGSIRMTRTR